MQDSPRKEILTEMADLAVKWNPVPVGTDGGTLRQTSAELQKALEENRVSKTQSENVLKARCHQSFKYLQRLLKS